MNYDSKYYEFATTSSPVPGTATPPEGERWVFVQMALTEKAPLQVVVVWARQKKA